MTARSGNASDPARLGGIEALRFAAATLIIVYHTVELPGIAIPASLNVIRTHFGLGVPLFYTLSGFVLAYGYMEALGTREQLLAFYVRRFFRIAPLFYAMLGVWMLFSKLRWPAFAVGPFELALNFSLLFGLVPGRHESIVWAGWSIGVEVLFYLVFPIFAALLRSKGAALAALMVFSVVSSLEFHALANSSLVSYAYPNLLTQLPFFLSGVLAYVIWRDDGFKRRAMVGHALLAGVLLTAISLVYVPGVFLFLASFSVITVDRYVWAIVFAALILAICYSPNPIVVNPVTRHLGKVSFSLYLLHPFLIATTMDLHHMVDRALGGGALGLAGRITLMLCALAPAASATYALVEKPAMSYGKRAAARI